MQKPLFHGTALMSRGLFRRLSGGAAGLAAGKGPETKERGCRVQPAADCEYITEDSEVRLYLLKKQKSGWPTVRRLLKRAFGLLKKASAFMLRLSGAAALTCLYAVNAIEHAYLQRGYEAYGGEYLVIPFVFYAAYKALRAASKIFQSVRRGDTYESRPGRSASAQNREAACGRKSWGG